MKELKIKRGLFIVLDHEKQKKTTFATLEAAQDFMKEPIVKEVENDPFDFTFDDDLTF